MTDTARVPSRFESALARRERALTLAILGGALLVQLNGILHQAYMGQDWLLHSAGADEAIRLPPFRWVIHLATSPPGLYWLPALVHYLTGSSSYIAATSFLFVVANLVALAVWARLSRAVITWPTLRLAALLAMTFMPARVVHSTVFAGDALAVLPFTLIAWLSYELFRIADGRRQAKLAIAACLVLLAGIYSKFTIASSVGVLLVLLVVLRRRIASRRVWMGALGALVLVPGLFAVDQYRAYSAATGPNRQSWAREMSWRSVFIPRAADVDVLRAPKYMEKVWRKGREVNNLLIDNRHSYPALLHLSTFTDILDVYQQEPIEEIFRGRSEGNQRLMTVAVWLAIPLSLLMICAVGRYLFAALASMRQPGGGIRSALALSANLAGDRELAALVVVAYGLAYFANIALFLPFVQYAYSYGYWLARLVLPALLGFCFLAFMLLDERLRSPAARIVVLVYAIAQAAIHVSFLWARGP